ncbi:MAG: cell division protein FtsZ [Anaerolineales bacterium]|nr:cell division protein FtsZ [Anaerolineales bacterium]
MAIYREGNHTKDISSEIVASDSPHRTVIRVIGLGGGGANAVDRMVQFGIDGVEFLAANTDFQALSRNEAPTKIVLGSEYTCGHGSGGDPLVGETAAYESRNEIAAALEGTDMLFIACGMGGGTGTGSAPVVAEIARELEAVTVSVVTMPFAFEGPVRYQNALQGINQLQGHCDTLITVPNDRLVQIVPRHVSLDVAFRMADDVLRQGIQAITELVTRPGLINVDFADVRELLSNSGGSMLAIGHGKGKDRSMQAVRAALHHPLQDFAALNHASGILVHFTSGVDLPLSEMRSAVEEIRKAVAPKAEVSLGVSLEEQYEDRVQIILLATGVGGHSLETVLAERPYQPSRIKTHDENELVLAPDSALDPPVDHPTKAPISPTERPTPIVEHFPHNISPQNLDTPAFLRRQRINSSIERNQF